MKQLFYRVIYHPTLNFLIRHSNRLAVSLFPCSVRIPPSGFIHIRDGMGRRIRLHTNQTNYLTHLLFWEGGAMQFEYTQIFVRLIRKVEGFYDIGANIGYYSLLAASEHPQIPIVGFEPASGPLYFFRKNVNINNFHNIRIEEIALSDTKGELTFYELRNKKYRYLKHNLAGESNAAGGYGGKNFVPVKVKSTTLDEYVETFHDNVGLIKMDTEGTEHLILSKAARTIASQKPIIICETLFNKIESELEDLMKSHNYLFFNHVDGGLKAVESIRRASDDGVRNCFFVHPDKLDLISEFIINE